MRKVLFSKDNDEIIDIYTQKNKIEPLLHAIHKNQYKLFKIQMNNLKTRRLLKIDQNVNESFKT